MLVMMNLIPHSQLFSMKSFDVITMLMSKLTKLCQKITLQNLHPNYHQQDKKQFDLQELELQETWLDSVTFWEHSFLRYLSSKNYFSLSIHRQYDKRTKRRSWVNSLYCFWWIHWWKIERTILFHDQDVWRRKERFGKTLIFFFRLTNISYTLMMMKLSWWLELMMTGQL